MKAFDKWEAIESKKLLLPGSVSCEHASAWKAALKWVLDRIDHSDELFEIQDYIQEELGEDEKDNGKYNNKCTK